MKVLVADDNLFGLGALAETRGGWGFVVVGVGDGAAAWQALQGDDAPRLAILDWMMPGLDGAQVCRRLRARDSGPYVYTLLLTSRDDARDIVSGLEAGADDYLTKPFREHELRARLGTGRRILDLQQELIAAREAMRRQATRDALTGLWNRGQIMQALERELARARREGTPLGVILLDVDHFKRVNDTHGHPVGDAVLREVARRLEEVFRAYDGVGRYGGEEFLVVLPGCDAAAALALAERARAAMAGLPLELAEAAVAFTISAGVAATGGAWTTDAGALLQTADAALYRAKRGGRDRVEWGWAAEAARAEAVAGSFQAR